MANCTRWDGLASTFAPQSIRRDTPSFVGISGASGGRSTPLMRPTIVCPPTRTAPVLPEETNASASPQRTFFMPTTIEESFLWRIALTGGSPVSMISVAGTISTRSFGYVYFCSSFSMTSTWPTSWTLTRSSAFTASTAPFTGSTGA